MTDRTRQTTSAMIASLAAEGRPTRSAPFGHALAQLANGDERIVGMTADLGKYTDLHVFGAQHPDRYFQMGMAEQLLMGAAAGMARAGLIPFVTTYAVFAARRAHDFICMAIAEEKLNVKIACALPGLTTGYGPSHQATDDLAIFRSMPNLTIIDPCDAREIEQAVPAMAAHAGPVYMRLLRGQVPVYLDDYDYRFVIGRAAMLERGPDALVITAGFMTGRVLGCARELAADGIRLSVLHTPTIKPLDNHTIVTAVKEASGPVIVVENHSIVGGLGEAVASLLMREGLTPKFHHISLPDEFLGAGALPTLHDRYGVSADKIAQSIRRWIADPFS